jgi:hypothetical protein|tara:strand:+ start:7166 stop:7612 length:447 start_codon:yes stop_codon:yes gene_type:complete
MRSLDDPKTRSTLLMAIAVGKTRAEACGDAGITVQTLRRQEKHDPDFADQVLDAEEAAFDQVERRMREMAVAGDSSMIKEYRSLKRRREAREARTSKLEVESTHTHVLEATDTIRELIGTLKQRQLSASVIEAEIIDEEPVKQEEIEA